MDGSFAHSPVFAADVLRDLFQANVLALLLKERMISPELVERMREWRHSGFHAYAGEEISDIEDALRVGLYMVRGPAATSRLRVDPSLEPKVRVQHHPITRILMAKDYRMWRRVARRGISCRADRPGHRIKTDGWVEVPSW
jgi:hypothetical protein